MVRIISWNILAPELLLYFWRSSYGLEIPDNFDEIQKSRIDNIISMLDSYQADVICLQEITDQRYQWCFGKRIQNYIADVLGFRVISESFKKSPINYNFPPMEQTQKLAMDSGVATLLRVDHHLLENILNANIYSRSEIFTSGIGSPFTFDLISVNGMEFEIVNTHIRMQYPHVLYPVNEVYDRLHNESDLSNAIIVGDFNASSCTEDILESKLAPFIFQKLECRDDLLFVGDYLVKNYNIQSYYDDHIDLFEMNINKPATGPMWKLASTSYIISDYNNELVQKHIATSDHAPIIIDIKPRYI